MATNATFVPLGLGELSSFIPIRIQMYDPAFGWYPGGKEDSDGQISSSAVCIRDGERAPQATRMEAYLVVVGMTRARATKLYA